MNNNCFNCDEKGHEFYGYTICDSCEKKLRLFTDKTVEKYALKFTRLGYEKEIKDRLILLENDFIKKRIKLLDILAKLEK